MSVKCEVKFRWWTHEGSNEPSMSYFIFLFFYFAEIKNIKTVHTEYPHNIWTDKN